MRYVLPLLVMLLQCTILSSWADEREPFYNTPVVQRYDISPMIGSSPLSEKYGDHENLYYYHKASRDFGTEPDARVKNAPSSLKRDISSLTRYITEGADTRYEKIRRIHDWIALNIDYDTGSFFSGRISRQSVNPAYVLRTGRSVCAGYSRLFQKMCSLAGITTEAVSGKSKSYTYSRTGRLGGHEWNIVEMDGKKYCIDVTWDAGYVRNRRFVRRYTLRNFMMVPEASIHQRFPDNAGRQYLGAGNSISMEEFARMPLLKGSFFIANLYDLKIAEYRSGITALTFTGKQNNLYLARIGKSRTHSFLKRKGDRVTIYALPPGRSKSTLNIYFKKSGGEGRYNSALRLPVRGSGKNFRQPFPRLYTRYHASGATLIGPLNGELERGREYTFRIKVPDAEAVAFIVNRRSVKFTQDGDTTYSCTYTPVTRGNLKIYFRKNGASGRSYQGLLNYTVR